MDHFQLVVVDGGDRWCIHVLTQHIGLIYGADVPGSQFKSWSLTFARSCYLAWCGCCGLLVGCHLIPMHPMRKTDRGGTAPY